MAGSMPDHRISESMLFGWLPQAHPQGGACSSEEVDPASKDGKEESFLYFPALCTTNRSEVTWRISDVEQSIGWLAQCTAVYTYPTHNIMDSIHDLNG